MRKLLQDGIISGVERRCNVSESVFEVSKERRPQVMPVERKSSKVKVGTCCMRHYFNSLFTILLLLD